MIDLHRAKLRARGHHLAQFGSSSSKSSSATTTTNTDARVANEGGAALSQSSGNVVNVNDPDAVKAIANMGSDVIARTGEAVVDLSAAATQANAAAWDSTLRASAQLVDKLADQLGAGFQLAGSAVERFEPTENKNADSMKIGLIAAAALAAVVLMQRGK